MSSISSCQARAIHLVKSTATYIAGGELNIESQYVYKSKRFREHRIDLTQSSLLLKIKPCGPHRQTSEICSACFIGNAYGELEGFEYD